MLWECYRYYSHGWISRYWIEPTYNFPYEGFEWVTPWPGHGMYIHFVVLAISALFILLGFLYRISTIIFFLGFTYVFLLEKANYLNHFYLICLISFLICFVPLHRYFSIDSILCKKIKSNSISIWWLWTVRLIIGIPYFFGGIAKINPDWLAGEPMRKWLAGRTDFPVIGKFFTEEWMVYLFCYGGLLFDLLVVPALIWKKTRVPAFIAAVSFHLVNSEMFSIGIFPWFMLFASLVFFSPDWPLRLLRRSRQALDPVIEPLPATKIFLSVFFLIQFLLPFRHFLYPGNVSWTEEGHNFAWHMKLRDKDTYKIVFKLTDPDTGQVWNVSPRKYLNQRQARKMSTRPHMILQFAHLLGEEKIKEGFKNIEVRVRTETSLNGRPAHSLIDPTVDLMKEKWGLRHSAWILPLAPGFH